MTHTHAAFEGQTPDKMFFETGKLYKRRLRDRYWEGHETRLL